MFAETSPFEIRFDWLMFIVLTFLASHENEQ
jgi:hypothetical protein